VPVTFHTPASRSSPSAVGSVDVETPIRGRNVIKTSHWQLSVFRKHVGHIPSPATCPKKKDGHEKTRENCHYSAESRRVYQRLWPVFAAASSDVL
jgi:hypothetical protein